MVSSYMSVSNAVLAGDMGSTVVARPGGAQTGPAPRTGAPVGRRTPYSGGGESRPRRAAPTGHRLRPGRAGGDVVVAGGGARPGLAHHRVGRPGQPHELRDVRLPDVLRLR